MQRLRKPLKWPRQSARTLVPWLAAGLVLAIAGGGALAAGAYPNGLDHDCPVVMVKVNGKTVESPVPGIIFSGSTLVPLRAIGEALGGEVEFDVPSYTARVRTAAGSSAGGTAGTTDGGSTGAATTDTAALRAEIAALKGVAKPEAVLTEESGGVTVNVLGVRSATTIKETNNSATAPSGSRYGVVDLEVINGGTGPIRAVLAGGMTDANVYAVTQEGKTRYREADYALAKPFGGGLLLPGTRCRGELAFVIGAQHTTMWIYYSFGSGQQGSFSLTVPQ